MCVCLVVWLVVCLLVCLCVCVFACLCGCVCLFVSLFGCVFVCLFACIIFGLLVKNGNSKNDTNLNELNRNSAHIEPYGGQPALRIILDLLVKKMET